MTRNDAMKPVPRDNKKSTRHLLALLIAAMVAANVMVLALSAHSLYQSRQQYQLRAETLTQNIASAVDQNVSDSIEKIDLALRSVADELERQLAGKGIDEAAMTAFLTRQEQRLPEVEAFRVANAEGLVILGKGLNKQARASWADRDYFIYHRDHADRTLQISKPRVGRVAQKYIVGFAQRYNTPDGRFAGVVSAPIALDHFAKLLTGFDVGPNGAVILRDADLGLITRVPAILDKAVGQVGNSDVSPDLKQIFAAGTHLATYHTPVSSDGFRRVVTFRRLEKAPIHVLVGLDEADYLAGWTTEAYQKVAIAFGFLLLSLLSTILLVRLLKEAERRDRQLNQRTLEAESASRAKSDFLANMSHEIRTPMNAVLGLLQLLQHTELSERQLDYAQKAQSAAQALLGILNDILDFSKVEAGKLELEQVPFRIDRVLRDLSVVLSAAVRNKDVEVLFDLDSSIPHALIGDPMRLQQVLLNLTGNAIKFTERGEVVVALRAITVDAGRARIEFTVRDSGIGIAADKLATIFDGFTQAESSTTRRFGGTGLGLTISVRLVRLMGGELRVSSVPGQGSRFYFTLDFARSAADTALDADERRLPGSGTERRRRLHVLIVDDNAIAREVLQHMVCQLGWTPDVASGGADAIARLEQAAADGRPYDTVLLDWKMPEMDGWAVAQHIRAHHLGDQSPVIIMVTAHGRETLAERLESATNPLDGFLVKPVTASMLFDAVADATAGGTVSANRRVAASPPGQALVGLRLLVVEDNSMNQQVARELLTYQGAQVEVAGDGRQGVERVAAAQPPFDAVLMDIQMPVMDGYEATRILREVMGRTTLPIIAMTAHALDSDREACLAAGMNDHVGKPIDINELVATLRRHCPLTPHMPGAEPLSAPRVRQDSPSVPGVQDMPNGFDLAVALQRLNGDRAFYAVLARNLRGDQGDSVEQARRQLAAGDHTGAARTLHTLKGVAATLGAQALAQQAAEVEASVKGGVQAVDSAVRFDQLAGALVEAIAVLEGVANSFAPAAAMPATQPAATDAIAPLLAELEPYLAASNMRALDILAALKQACGGALPAEHAALEAALNRLDFVAALAESRRWRDEMPRMGYGAGALSGDAADFKAAACDELKSKNLS
jgi:signal transduction histidine kinase/DNA-binding response OmpR family regulator/HPt (histidine-containing phosphotransfer) domain-containing protein